VLELPFNMTVQTRGLLEADTDTIASLSARYSQQPVNHSRTLRCTDEVLFFFSMSNNNHGVA